MMKEVGLHCGLDLVVICIRIRDTNVRSCGVCGRSEVLLHWLSSENLFNHDNGWYSRSKDSLKNTPSDFFNNQPLRNDLGLIAGFPIKPVKQAIWLFLQAGYFLFSVTISGQESSSVLPPGQPLPQWISHPF